MEYDSAAAEVFYEDHGREWEHQDNSNYSVLPAQLPTQHPATEDNTVAPSASANDGSAVVLDSVPLLPHPSPSGGVRATIWAPAGFKQPTYRSVQFCPPTVSEATTLAQAHAQVRKCSTDSDRSCGSGVVGGEDYRTAAVASVSPLPPWYSTAAPLAPAAAAAKSAEDRPQPVESYAPAVASSCQPPGAPWTVHEPILPVAEQITSTAAPVSERCQPSSDGVGVSRPASVARRHREPLSAHVTERLSHDVTSGGGSSRCSSSSSSAADTCGGAEDNVRSNSLGASDDPQLISQHRKSAVPPTVAPKPNKGVRLFIAQQHREAESHAAPEAAELGNGSPSLPPPQPWLSSGSRNTDDEDAASVTSDASSASSTTGKRLPLVPPKPRLRPSTSLPMAAAVVPAAGTPNGQHHLSSSEPAAASAGELAMDSESRCDYSDDRNLQQPQQLAAPPPVMLRPRARPPEPPVEASCTAADGGSSAAGGSKRKSLYEIVSTEGRRDDDAIAVQQQTTLRSAPVCQQRVTQRRYAEQEKYQVRDATMTCSACSSASGGCAAHAPPPRHQQQQQQQQQQYSPAPHPESTGFDFPLRLPPTKPSSMTLLQRQRGDTKHDCSAEATTTTATPIRRDYLPLAARSPVLPGDGVANDEHEHSSRTPAAGCPSTSAVIKLDSKEKHVGCGAAISADKSPEGRDYTGDAAPSLSWAQDCSWTNESPLQLGDDHPPPETTEACSHSARPRRRSAMQTLLCSPTHERSRSLGNESPEVTGGGGRRGKGASASDTSSDSGRESSPLASPVGHRGWYKKMFRQMHAIDKPGEVSFRVLETIRAYEDGKTQHFSEPDMNDNHAAADSETAAFAAEAAADVADGRCTADVGISNGEAGDSPSSHSAYVRVQLGGDVPLSGFRKQLPTAIKSSASPKSPPGDSGALRSQTTTPETGYYREQTLLDRNVRDEQHARRRLIMEQVEAEEKRRKAEKEKLDLESRRHSDFFTPSAKMSITESRFDEFLASTPVRSPTKVAAAPQTRIMVRALYSFTAENPKELTFRKGDIICLVKQLDKNWLVGELDGRVGIFPGSYVEACQNGVDDKKEGEPEEVARAKYNFKSSGGTELSLRKGDRVTLVKRVDANWYEARDSLGRRGIVPASYLELPAEKEKAPLNATEARSPESDNGSSGLTKLVASAPYRALYDYEKQRTDELELRQGDIVTVSETCDDGWMLGYSWRTGGFGVFPGNYIALVENGSLLL